MVALISGIVMLTLLFADQITKAAAEIYSVSQPFLGDFMSLHYVQNTGIAFSIFGDNPAGMAVVTALTAVMIVVIGVVFFKVFKRNTPVRIALAVIEAGAIGNFIDRLCLVNESGMRYVRDFLDMSNFRPFAWLGSNFNFGVCNLADFYITFGAVALVLILLFIGKDAVIPLKKSWREQAKKEKLRETEDAEERGD